MRRLFTLLRDVAAIQCDVAHLRRQFRLAILQIRQQRQEMKTFKEILDDLKTAQDAFVTKALGIIAKQASGETVTDEERAEVQAMADALTAASASLPSDAPADAPSA